MNRIEILDNLKVISNENEKICIKKVKNPSTINKYKYLKAKGFYNVIDYSIKDGFEVRKYIDEVNISIEDKISELIYLIYFLYTIDIYTLDSLLYIFLHLLIRP